MEKVHGEFKRVRSEDLKEYIQRANVALKKAGMTNGSQFNKSKEKQDGK